MTTKTPGEVWHDRALAADCGRRQCEAAADTYMDADDRPGDPYFSTLRTALFRAECAKADAYALYAEHCSDSAREAEHGQAERRGRYAEPVELKWNEHARGHTLGHQPGPGGLTARWCKVEGCDFRDTVKASA